MMDTTTTKLPIKNEKLDKYVTFANSIIMPYWRQPMDIVSKIEPDRPIGESLVTIADQNCEKALHSLTETNYPSHDIYGEEFGSVRVYDDFVWVLDPIDGIKLFITGKPVFCTLIALLYKGFPIIGITEVQLIFRLA